MGDLARRIPITFWTMFIATLAISGIPGLAGFFSKDEILWQTWRSEGGAYRFLWFVGYATAIMNLGAFAVIASLRRRDVIGDEIDDIAGLYHRAPVEAVLMLIFLLSLAGIPPMAGFLAKYFIFLSLIESQHYLLAALAVLYALFGLYYYMAIRGAEADRSPLIPISSTACGNTRESRISINSTSVRPRSSAAP